MCRQDRSWRSLTEASSVFERKVFFTIFQTFMSGPEKDGKSSPYFGEYPPDFFDFIVIDECERGACPVREIG
jgi:type I site-specific restriction endonuclease